MRLRELLGKYYSDIINDIEVFGVYSDTRIMKPNSVFVCVRGSNEDGHRYALRAYELGASVIISDRKLDIPVAVILVDNTKEALIYLTKRFYNGKKPKMVAITGTNGKTTTSYMVASIFNEAQKSCAVVGTNGVNFRGVDEIKTAPTTPCITELYEIMEGLYKSGVKWAATELSSHALEQGRAEGLLIEAGIFTNLTHDHLDYHKTMENYFKAKRKLFEICKVRVINADDDYGKRLLEEFDDAVSYGINDGKIRAYDINMTNEGTSFDLAIEDTRYNVHMKIGGLFNVYNALGAAGAAFALGISPEQIAAGLEKTENVSGRMERIRVGRTDVVIDYAHTPDGLENALKAVKGFSRGRVIAVFGCGGDRDRKKRPEMARIATSIADFTVITSDNPRCERPSAIISDIINGVASDRYIVIEDRKKAIEAALMLADKDDVILLAGKGQERYQIIGKEKHHFDEREIVAGYTYSENGIGGLLL